MGVTSNLIQLSSESLILQSCERTYLLSTRPGVSLSMKRPSTESHCYRPYIHRIRQSCLTSLYMLQVYHQASPNPGTYLSSDQLPSCRGNNVAVYM